MKAKVGLSALWLLIALLVTSDVFAKPRAKSRISPAPEDVWEIVGKNGSPVTCAAFNGKNLTVKKKGAKYLDVKKRLREIKRLINDAAAALPDPAAEEKRKAKLQKEQKNLKKVKSNGAECLSGKPPPPPVDPTPTPVPPTPTPTPIPDQFSMEPYAGPVDTKVVRYLLEKAAYGLSSSEQAILDRADSEGISGAVDELMAIKPEDDTLADRMEDRKNANNGVGGGSGLGDLSTQSRNAYSFRGFRQAVLELAINTRNPFRENLRHFLLGLWTVGHDVLTNNPTGNPQRVLWWDYFELLGDVAYNKPLPQDYLQAFPNKAKFPTQLVRVGRHPMMLLYLSNNQNVIGNVNENYARELQELFSLGTQRYDEASGEYVDNYVEFRNGGNRTLGDIYRIARNISGWRVSPFLGGDGMMYWRGVFSPEDHDPEVLPIFEGTPHAFNSSSDADVVFGIFEKHPGTRQFLAKQLLEWYVTKNPPYELIKSFGEVLFANDYDLESSMRVLLNSKAFYHPDYENTMVKNSFKVGVELARILELARHDIGDQALEVGVNITGREGTPDQEFVTAYTQGSIARMGYTTTLPSEGVFFFPQGYFSKAYTLMETGNLASAYLASTNELARLLDSEGRGWLPQRVLPEGDYSAEEVIRYVADRMGVNLSQDDVDNLVYYMDYRLNVSGVYTRVKYDNLLNGIPSDLNGGSVTNHQSDKARWLYAMMALHPDFMSQ